MSVCRAHPDAEKVYSVPSGLFSVSVRGHDDIMLSAGNWRHYVNMSSKITASLKTHINRSISLNANNVVLDAFDGDLVES